MPSYLFCTTPIELKLPKDFYGIFNKYWSKQVPEEGHQVGITHLGTPGGPGAPVGAALLGPPPVPIFWYTSGPVAPNGAETH